MYFDFPNTRRVVYGEDRATFVPKCEKCGRFVTPNKVIHINEITGLKEEPNAYCSRCGPTKMLFEGFM